MFGSIKNFFLDLKGKIIAIFTVVIGILLLVLNWRKKKYEATAAKLELANTQKKADLIEAEIKHEMENVEQNKHTLKELESLQAKLDSKRKEIDSKPMSDKEIEDYWNK